MGRITAGRAIGRNIKPAPQLFSFLSSTREREKLEPLPYVSKNGTYQDNGMAGGPYQ
jgi:hypothetical protein